MPNYTFTDKNGHVWDTFLTFDEYAQQNEVLCGDCGEPMHRLYKDVAVNWDGLPPHEADARSPEIKDFLKNADESRAMYSETKARLTND